MGLLRKVFKKAKTVARKAGKIGLKIAIASQFENPPLGFAVATGANQLLQKNRRPRQPIAKATSPPMDVGVNLIEPDVMMQPDPIPPPKRRPAPGPGNEVIPPIRTALPPFRIPGFPSGPVPTFPLPGFPEVPRNARPGLIEASQKLQRLKLGRLLPFIRKRLPIVIGLELGVGIFTRVQDIDFDELFRRSAGPKVATPIPAGPRGRRRRSPGSTTASRPGRRRRPIPGVTPVAIRPKMRVTVRPETAVATLPPPRSVRPPDRTLPPPRSVRLPDVNAVKIDTSELARLQKTVDQLAIPTITGSPSGLTGLRTAELASVLALTVPAFGSNRLVDLSPGLVPGIVVNPAISPSLDAINQVANQVATDASIATAGQDVCFCKCRSRSRKKRKKSRKVCLDKGQLTRAINQLR